MKRKNILGTIYQEYYSPIHYSHIIDDALVFWDVVRLSLNFMVYGKEPIYSTHWGMAESLAMKSWALIQYCKKMSSYHNRKSHCGDKTVIRSSYLRNGISYTGKM